MTTYEGSETRVVHQPTGRPLVRWGAVFSGAVIGLAVMGLLTALWLALGYGSNIDQVAGNLAWYLGGSAIACMFLAGILAGYLSGVRGPGTGILHGLTVWGLLTIVTVTVGLPAILNLFGISRVFAANGQPANAIRTANGLWTGFWTLLIAFGTAALGGLFGGLVTRDQRQEVSSATTVAEPDALVAPHRPDAYQREPERTTTAVRHPDVTADEAEDEGQIVVLRDEHGAYRDERGRPVVFRDRDERAAG